jgi:hypothetical protein
MTLVRNALAHPYSPTRGPTLAPRETADVDLSYAQEIDAVIIGALTVLDADYVPPTVATPELDGLTWRAPVATEADLPAIGNINGDVRLVLETPRSLWTWNGATMQWGQIATGAGGGAGGGGNVILNGTGAPSSGLGSDGDFYIDTAADAIYGPKSAGAWGSATSLIGPQGPTGSTGPAGADGAFRTVQDEGVTLTQRQTVNFTGAGVEVSDNAGQSRTDVSISGQLYDAVTDTPEAHGAKRDGRMLTDAAITTGTSTLTSASGPFTSADVGKTIHVRNAAAGTNVGLTTTISAYISATQVTLAVNAGATVSGQVAVYGTDDTAAWVAAVAAAVTACQADKTYYCEVVGSNGIYMIAGAPTLGGGSPDTKGNAQIPLPVVHPSTGQKVILKLGGAHFSAGQAHWDQTMPQMSGCVLFSPLVGQASNGTYGVPAVIGGPSIDLTGPTETFSNMRLIIDGLSVIVPFNPSLSGIDVRRLAQCDVLSLTVQTLATPDADGGTPNFATKPTNSNATGLYLPRMNNNDSNNIVVYHCSGFYYGIGFSDHLTAQKLLLLYCDTAMFVNNVSGSPQHGSSILYASVEACNRAIDTNAASGGWYPLTIDMLDVEIIAGPYDINDPNNSLRGNIGFIDPPPKRAPRINGGKHLRVEDLAAARGALSGTTYPLAPGVPKSGGGTTTITGVSQASPAVVTAAGHGLTTGQVVHISGLSGPQVDLVNGQQIVTVIDANTFSIAVNTTTKAYSSGGGIVNHAWVPFKDALACITGGTVTAVTIDGVATGLTSGAFVVPVAKKLEITYSVAPTLAVTLL